MLKMDNKKGYNFTTYMIAIILFILGMFTLLGIRKTISEYKEIMAEEYHESEVEKFHSALNTAVNLGKYSLNEATIDLERCMKDSLDLDKLRISISEGQNYPEFEQLLREYFQTNIYTQFPDMSANRNNVFILANERIIASYTHDSSKLSSGNKVKNIRDIIDSNFYNTELSTDAINKIESQYDGLIIWQSREPRISELKKYKSITPEDLCNIFMEYGVEGLESFEILIPSYITSYGNIFDEYDIPGETSPDNNNKIIVIQKLNLADYINCFLSAMFQDNLIDIIRNYDILTNMVNILIIIDCLTMIAYALVFVSLYNHEIILEETLDQKEILTDKNEENNGVK